MKKDIIVEKESNSFNSYYNFSPNLEFFDLSFEFVKECLLLSFKECDIKKIEDVATGITCGFRYCKSANEQLHITIELCSFLGEDNEAKTMSVFSKLVSEVYTYWRKNQMYPEDFRSVKNFPQVAEEFLINIGIWQKDEDYNNVDEYFWSREWDIEYNLILWRGLFASAYEEFVELCHFIGLDYLGVDYDIIWGLSDSDIKKIWDNIDLLKKYQWEFNFPESKK